MRINPENLFEKCFFANIKGSFTTILLEIKNFLSERSIQLRYKKMKSSTIRVTCEGLSLLHTSNDKGELDRWVGNSDYILTQNVTEILWPYRK